MVHLKVMYRGMEYVRSMPRSGLTLKPNGVWDGKNNFEFELLQEQLKRLVRKPVKADYVKVTNVQMAKNVNDQIHNYLQNDLTVIVYNFIDMLSHARTEMEVLKEFGVNKIV